MPTKILRLLQILTLAVVFLVPTPYARAQVALVLAIDSSLSMHENIDSLRQAHADALRHPAVAAALTGSRVSVALWGGWARLALPWREIRTPEDALRLADEIDALGPDQAQTSGIEGLLHHALTWWEACACPALPLVLDVASDGIIPWTGGLGTARARLLDEGATINTLHVPPTPPEGPEMEEVARYAALGAERLRHLAGGPRSFATAPEGAEDVARALRRKILAEVAALVP